MRTGRKPMYNDKGRICCDCKIFKDWASFAKELNYKTSAQYSRRCNECSHKEPYLNRHKLNQKKWASKNRHKILAHAKLHDEIKAGRIIKSDKCQNCDSTNRIHAHHSDYSKPLKVDWLCHNCHENKHHTRRFK